MLSIFTTVDDRAHGRPTVRYLTAALAAAAALIYLLIGTQLVSVFEPVSDQTAFGLMAGGVYALGAVLLLTIKRRIVWVLGALFQVMVIFMYFNLAPERTPSFEVWGITLRVIQVVLLIGLVYLAAKPRSHGPESLART
jgi:hypothetical protein